MLKIVTFVREELLQKHDSCINCQEEFHKSLSEYSFKARHNSYHFPVQKMNGWIEELPASTYPYNVGHEAEMIVGCLSITNGQNAGPVSYSTAMPQG